jgi:hypothetical protein
MKKIIFPLIIISLGIFNCKDENITTGLAGNVKYGQGDCMPAIDPLKRVYSNYNGKLYFISKSEIANQVTGTFEDLKANSINTRIKNGKFSVELPIDTFLVMPSDVNLYSDYNTVIIEESVVLEKDFSFWKCTSY